MIGALVIARPLAARAEPSACEPARLSPDRSARPESDLPDGGPVALPQAWRAALDDLLEAASGEGQPWDCSGALLALSLEGSTAVLTVDLPEGHRVTRAISSPELVKPTGEAVLTRVELGPSTDTTHDSTASRATLSRPTTATSSAARTSEVGKRSSQTGELLPRFVLDSGLVARFAAPPSGIWLGGMFRVTIPFDLWSGAAWVRYDVPAWLSQVTPPDFSMSEVCLGLSFGRRFVGEPIELRVSVGPSLAVVREAGGNEPDYHEASRPYVRVGSDIEMAWPFAKVGRLFVANDFEVSPQNFDGQKRLDSTLPLLPTFSVGLTAGVGLAIQ